MAEYISFQPTDFFNTVLYTGTGAEQTISGVGFEPGLTWCKDRTNSYDQVWYDAARGATKRITSNTTGAESDQAQGLKSWNSDGFVVGTGSNINNNTNNFVSWNWKAGTTSVPSGGTITPSACSFSATSGFGAYAYTGTATNGTIAHGLGKVPGMIIVKQLSGTEAWRVYHQNINAEDYLVLNTTAEWVTETANWNNTTATSTVFSIGTDTSVNSSGVTFIAYVFANIPGFLKCGKYLGNGNADGQFIYTGFRPAMIICKEASAAGQNWELNDNKRNPYNEAKNTLRPNSSDAENTTNNTCDLLSNGFKLRTSNDATNKNGATFIYAAFAEFPIVSSNDVPVVAR